MHPLLEKVVVLISLRSNDLLPAPQSGAGSSSARLECLLWEQEVVSSNLAYPTKTDMYRAIFIDIDDTLLDYIPCCREAFDFALAQISNLQSQITNEEELFELFFAISGRLFSEAKHGLHTVAEVMELYPAEFCERAGYPPSAVDPFKHAFRAAWGKTHTLVPDAKQTLEAWRGKGYRLFAASNSFGHLQRSRLQHAGLLHLFEDTYISMDLGYDKPDIRFYQEALRRCGLQPAEVLMIGDSMTTDIIGAREAGLGVLYFNRRNEPLPAHSDIPSVSSLSQILEIV